jgi:Tfp pilus assembly protein PilV
MSHPKFHRTTGFVLIEALVALVIIALGLLAVSRLQLASLGGAGEAKARSEAAACAQQQIEAKRNILLAASYSGLSSIPSATCTSASGIVGSPGYTVNFTYTVNATLKETLVQATTTWTDNRSGNQTLSLNSQIAWDDPGADVRARQNVKTTLISPTGQAERCSSGIAGCTGLTGGTSGAGGTSIRTDGSGGTYLYKGSTGLLYLPPDVNGTAQTFTTITGKVYFDTAAGNKIPSASNVRVRLSSEGECVYDNTTTTSVTGAGISYTYFAYTCFVGPGWYGNVGVTIDDSVNGNAANATLCVGDPSFNGGVSDGTLISVHPAEASVRSYRGFKANPDTSESTTFPYLATGMMGGRHYGVSDGTAFMTTLSAAPYDGRPRPSSYPTWYSTITAGGPTDFFEQNFLVTSISGNASCKSRMGGGASVATSVFVRNAGQYFCINPDNDSAADVCPSTWPGFTATAGGSLDYALTVGTSGSGTVAITSPSAVSCSTGCTVSYPSGTTVTLVATANAGASFSSWTGCASTSGTTCTVVVDAAKTVTASFASAVTNTLTVTNGGAGTGIVTSDVGGIICPTTCSATYGSATSVTLAAVATNGSTFAGWGGACSASGTSPTCIVSVSGAVSVTASFTAPITYTLTINRVAGTMGGTVTSSSGGINCPTTCSAAYISGASVTLTAVAPAGGTFSSWSGACSGTATTCTVTLDQAKTVTATFANNASCTMSISGTAADKQGAVTVSGATSGTCTMANGSSVYQCSSIVAPTGATITLTNARTTGQTYSYTKTLTQDCKTHTNVNFP